MRSLPREVVFMSINMVLLAPVGVADGGSLKLRKSARWMRPKGAAFSMLLVFGKDRTASPPPSFFIQPEPEFGEGLTAAGSSQPADEKSGSSFPESGVSLLGLGPHVLQHFLEVLLGSPLRCQSTGGAPLRCSRFPLPGVC